MNPNTPPIRNGILQAPAAIWAWLNIRLRQVVINDPRRMPKLKPLVSHRLPLERSVEAIKLLTDRKALGKVVVVPGRG